VPTWNGAAFLDECLLSVRAQSYSRIESIVVDDGSTDDTPALVRDRYPEVRLLTLAHNCGFARAANEGMRAARGSVVALLNNDAVADTNWVAELVAALNHHPRAGSVASKILLREPQGMINGAGDVFLRSGVPSNRGAWERDSGQYEEEIEVFGASGGAVGYRQSMLEQVGLFDERFFMYCEDVDLAFRSQIAGYRCVYSPRAIVRHRLSATGGGTLASYYSARNIVWVLARDVPWSAWRRFWPRIIAEQARRASIALYHSREPAARAQLRGMLVGLFTARRLARERPRIFTQQSVPDTYLLSVLT